MPFSRIFTDIHHNVGNRPTLAGNDLYLDDVSGNLNSELDALTGWSGVPANIRPGWASRSFATESKLLLDWANDGSITDIVFVQECRTKDAMYLFTETEIYELDQTTLRWVKWCDLPAGNTLAGATHIYFDIYNDTCVLVALAGTGCFSSRLNVAISFDKGVNWEIALNPRLGVDGQSVNLGTPAILSNGRIMICSPGTNHKILTTLDGITFAVWYSGGNTYKTTDVIFTSRNRDKLLIMNGYNSFTLHDAVTDTSLYSVFGQTIVGIASYFTANLQSYWYDPSDPLKCYIIFAGDNDRVVYSDDGFVTYSNIVSAGADGFAIACEGLIGLSAGRVLGFDSVSLLFKISSDYSDTFVNYSFNVLSSFWTSGKICNKDGDVNTFIGADATGAIYSNQNLSLPIGDDSAKRGSWFYMQRDGGNNLLNSPLATNSKDIIEIGLMLGSIDTSDPIYFGLMFTDANGYPLSALPQYGGQDSIGVFVEFYSPDGVVFYPRAVVSLRPMVYPASEDDTITPTFDDMLVLTQRNCPNQKAVVCRFVKGQNSVITTIYDYDEITGVDYSNEFGTVVNTLTADIVDAVFNQFAHPMIMTAGGSGSVVGGGSVDNFFINVFP